MNAVQRAEDGKIRRLESVDALRGIAATYVVAYHMKLIPQPNLAVSDWLDPFVGGGGSGVTLFFVVSAFSLYYTMPTRLKEERPILSFYMHRLFRIAPLFYLMMFLTSVRDYYAFSVAHGPWEILSNLLFVFNLIPGSQIGYVWASWTIGVEMLFYLAFPFIYYRVRDIWAALALLLGAILLFMFARTLIMHSIGTVEQQQSYAQWTVLRHLPLFVFGIMTFFLAEKMTLIEGEQKKRLFGLIFILAAFLLYASMLGGRLPQIFPDVYYWQGVVYALLVLGCLLNPLPLIVNRLTSFLGKLSYSVYLIHPSMVFFMAPLYRKIYGAVPDVFTAFTACFLLTMCVVVALSYVTYRFVEEPGIRLGKKLFRAPMVMERVSVNSVL